MTFGALKTFSLFSSLLNPFRIMGMNQRTNPRFNPVLTPRAPAPTPISNPIVPVTVPDTQTRHNSVWFPLPNGFNQSDADSILGRVAASSGGSRLPFSHVYIFGDSACDTGRLFVMSEYTDPRPDVYWDGRFSNGPMWPDYLQAQFGLSLINYAYGGATVLNSNYENGVNIPDFPGQIEIYKRENFKANNPLAIIQFVGNDLVGKKVNSQRLASDIEHQLKTLLDLGEIRNFLILGTSVRSYSDSGFDIALNEMVNRFSNQYQSRNVKIHFYPLLGHYADMAANPPVTADPSRWDGDGKSCYYASTNRVCPDPENYMRFDLYHPTTVPNYNIARYIGEEIMKY